MRKLRTGSGSECQYLNGKVDFITFRFGLFLNAQSRSPTFWHWNSVTVAVSSTVDSENVTPRRARLTSCARAQAWSACFGARPNALAGRDWRVRAFSLPRFPSGMRTSSLHCSTNSGEGWAATQPCVFRSQRYTELLPRNAKDMRGQRQFVSRNSSLTKTLYNHWSLLTERR